MIRVFAPAKINLFLHVTGRRADGYHLLESLVAFADIGDEIAVSLAPDLTLNIDGPYGAALGTSENLVMIAAQWMRRNTGITKGARMTLTKNLPIASGLGGGSSDAAATLSALQHLWGISPSLDSSVLARELGADVPVCLAAAPTLMRGIGEELMPITAFPDCSIVLANPGFALSTADVFNTRTGAYTPAHITPLQGWRDVEAMTAFLRTTDNDLTPPAMKLGPGLHHVLNTLNAQPGCLLSRMSGSGATCFGLFGNDAAAHMASRILAEQEPTWWVKHAKLTCTAPERSSEQEYAQ